MNIADKLFSTVSYLVLELDKMQSLGGESLTLYAFYFTAFNYVPDSIRYDNTG